jgi:alpha-tubulin suppressor-like RCC1 family protein
MLQGGNGDVEFQYSDKSDLNFSLPKDVATQSALVRDMLSDISIEKPIISLPLKYQAIKEVRDKFIEIMNDLKTASKTGDQLNSYISKLKADLSILNGYILIELINIVNFLDIKYKIDGEEEENELLDIISPILSGMLTTKYGSGDLFKKDEELCKRLNILTENEFKTKLDDAVCMYKIRKQLGGQLFTFGNDISDIYRVEMPEKYIYNNNVEKVACGDWHTAMIKDGQLYTFGNNNRWGQLGLGHNNTIHVPTLVPNTKDFDNKDVTTVVSRGKFTAIIKGRRLYYFGRIDDRYSLIPPNILQATNKPTLVSGTDGTTFVACGENHIAIIKNGQLYTFGANMHGQLGLNDTNNRLEPTLVPDTDGTTAVACGLVHTAIIKRGKLYTFGANSSGQLGLGHSDDIHVPTLVPNTKDFTNENVTEVSCGTHTVIIKGGKLYTFGYNSNGQLGFGEFSDRNTTVNVPTLVPNTEYFKNENVTKVSCNETATCIIKDGQLYTFGENAKEVLGHKEYNIYNPTPIDREKFLGNDVIDVACGSSYVTAVITN